MDRRGAVSMALRGPGNLSFFLWKQLDCALTGFPLKPFSPPLYLCAWFLRSNAACRTDPSLPFSVYTAFLPIQMFGTCFLAACLGVLHQPCPFFQFLNCYVQWDRNEIRALWHPLSDFSSCFHGLSTPSSGFWFARFILQNCPIV